VCVCVCVCVRERQRERERDTHTHRGERCLFLSCLIFIDPSPLIPFLLPHPFSFSHPYVTHDTHLGALVYLQTIVKGHVARERFLPLLTAKRKQDRQITDFFTCVEVHVKM